MIKMSERLSRIAFADPRRGQAREFIVGDGVVVSNIDRGVVIVECFSYGVYTDAEVIGHLVHCAAASYSRNPVLLSIQPAPARTRDTCDVTLAWKLLYQSRAELRYEIGFPDADRVSRAFDAWGRYESWTFALPRKATNVALSGAARERVEFESALQAAAEWSFVLTVDLDGGLIGFMSATHEFDEFERDFLAVKD